MVRNVARPTRLLAWAGFAGPVGFTLAVVLSPSLEPRYDWLREDISALFARDAAHPWVMASGVLALGLGSIALAAGLHGTLDRGEPADIGRVLVLGLGIAVCTAAIFRNDCSTETVACAARVRTGDVSWQHHVHDASSGLIFVLLLASPLVLAHAFRADPRWAGMDRWSTVTGIVGFALLLAYFFAPGGGGLLQRLAIGVPVLWLAGVSWHLTRIKSSQVAGAPTAPRSVSR
jgi:hypothetical membrane protein